LITGDLSGADEIIDNLPAQPGLRGYCNLLPFEMLAGCLPLPAPLGERHTWIAGSPQQAALRQWLDQHRHALRWDEVEVEYRWLAPPAGESQSALD